MVSDPVFHPAPFDPTSTPPLGVTSLARLAGPDRRELALAHDRPEHLLIWITRGQGVALLDGTRRGIGPHHALFVPARHLMALDPGRNGLGLVLRIPPDSSLTLPARPCHLRPLDVATQAELTALFEAMQREQDADRPLRDEAMQAQAELAAIWLRRHVRTNAIHLPDTAATELSRAYCAQVAARYHDPGGVARHAAILGVSPTHLGRACREQTGRTAAVLLAERIEYAARRLITATDVPFTEIARHLGFSGAAAFSRFVRRQTGSSPSALRASNRKPD